MPVISISSPFSQPPVRGRVGQRERDRARGGVAVAVDVNDDPLLGIPSFFDRVLDDPHVRLVRT